MSEPRNFMALDWVKGEIEDTLRSAREALEAFFDTPDDTTLARQCLTSLHQVNGTLQMVELHGAAALATEMESTAQALMNDSVQDTDAALESLMEGILQLPSHLDRVHRGGEDDPRVHALLMDRMRVARGEEPRTRREEMAVDPEAVAAFLDSALPVETRKLRSNYQRGMVALIRKQQPAEKIWPFLDRIFTRLEQITPDSPLQRLWGLAAGVMEIRTVDGESQSSVVPLLRGLDQQLKDLVASPEATLSATPPPKLREGLAAIVNASEHDSERLSRLRQALVPVGDQPVDSGPVGADDETIATVARALHEELSDVRDRLDLHVRGSVGDARGLQSIGEDLKRVAGTLQVVGLEELQQTIAAQAEWIRDQAEQGRPDEDAILEIASAVLFVDSALMGLAGIGSEDSGGMPGSLSDANSAVLREARASLDTVKQSIIDFISSQWDHDHLEKVPATLDMVRSVLAMIPLERPAALIEACRDYVRDRVLENRVVPEWQRLDSLADAITSIDYFLERLLEDRVIPDPRMLEIAEESIAALADPVDGKPISIPDVQAPDEDQPPPLAELDETPDAAGPPEPEVEQAPAPEADESSAFSAPVEDDFDLELDESAGDAGREEAQEEAPSTAAQIPEVGEPEPRAPADDDASALIDDEIIEIFLEEVGEVLEAMDGALSAWSASPDDQQALAEIRRGWHTLKGSGRMVGASVLGELAWSIENMLNRVLDGTIEPSPLAIDLVSRTRALVPELRNAFSEQRDPDTDVSPLMERADVLASGGGPDDLDDLPAEAAATAPVEPDPVPAEEATPSETAPSADREDRTSAGAPADDEPSYLAGPAEDDFDLGLDDLDEIDSGAALDLEPHPEPRLDIGPAADVAAEEAAAAPADATPSGMSAPAEDDFDLGADFELDEADDASTATESTLLDLFEEEAGGHLDTVRAWLQQAASPAAAPPLSDSLRRALHTLKGSAAMADFPGLSDLAAPLEKLVRAHLELQRPVDQPLLQILAAGVRRIEAVLEHMRQAGAEPVFARAERDYLAEADTLLKRLEQEIDRRQDRGGAEGATLGGIFRSEDIDLLIDAVGILRDWTAGRVDARREALREELRATSVRAREAGQQRLADLASALTSAHDRLGPQLNDDSRARLEQAHEALVGMLDALAAGLEVPSADEALAELCELTGEVAPVAGVRESIAELDLDPDMVEIFFEEADELFETIDAALESWPAGDDRGAEELMRALHTLKGGARMAGLGGLGSEAHELESWIGARREAPDAEFFAELRRRCDTMAERIAALRRGEAITIPGALEAPAAEEAASEEAASEETATEEAASPGEAEGSPATTVEARPEAEPEAPAAAAEPATAPAAARAADAEDLEEADPEILELFREEAGELLEMLDSSVLGWRGEPANEIHLEGLLRALHTLKGSARMAGLADLGEAAHELESRLVERRGHPDQLDDAFFAALQADTDALSERIAALAGVPAPGGETDPGDASAEPAPEPEPESESGKEAAATALPSERTPDLPGSDGRARADGPVRESREEMIRVSSDLLDDLVSLAGETSITRGRIQQEISDFSAALEEMDATIERIRDQVRRLDSTAQEQIHFGREVAEQAQEHFDPLEMDRYTQLQELTRTLFESASDVGDLRETLVDRLRNADTLLLQQARINTELQEGLMRTRMVPFARLLPRLKRIVRQVGRELGKPVELEVENAEGELDRNVLERMIAPLEHMLRNAVDHGLEKPEVRTERGKPYQGTITLRLSQPGGEILIEVADDGGGINVEGVRAKAIERGLLSVESDPDESEILSFIMSPGFSTAKSVTQLSGRGVGMDVVNSEVKQLGGSITVASSLGEGTTFSVRLPFTVSVSRALMVSVGDDSYAIPLAGIEGIIRVPPSQLQRRYDSGQTSFDYAGRSYELSALAEWLGLSRTFPDDVPSVPVLMVRAGEVTRAVHVDAVSGSREIVVKNLGPQFAGVAGVSGATILGDGSVVVILDLPAMLRGGASLRLVEGGVRPAAEPAAPRKRHVMVVDDSVTVRKVTSRLLERQGFRVSLAKDGVEAVGLLAETRPDLMLLDIEMPRMDGFEVATHVRNEARLADLPIIMITSRTGEKHRERALAIGVDRFLGKPFQEPDLLAAIEELTGS